MVEVFGPSPNWEYADLPSSQFWFGFYGWSAMCWNEWKINFPIFVFLSYYWFCSQFFKCVYRPNMVKNNVHLKRCAMFWFGFLHMWVFFSCCHGTSLSRRECQPNWIFFLLPSVGIRASQLIAFLKPLRTIVPWLRVVYWDPNRVSMILRGTSLSGGLWGTDCWTNFGQESRTNNLTGANITWKLASKVRDSSYVIIYMLYIYIAFMLFHALCDSSYVVIIIIINLYFVNWIT